MRIRIIIAILSLFLAPSSLLFAQKEASDVRRGNREYNKQNYTEAEVNYRRGLEKNKNGYEAHYNLGEQQQQNQDQQQDQQEQQQQQQEQNDDQMDKETAAKMLDKKEDKTRYAKAMHNIGNCQFAQQQYDKAVAAYQESLRANPADNDTRYNLVKSMQMLQQQQQQQQQNRQNQDQKQDQKQDQQQQQQNQDQQQQQQQNQDQQQDQQEQQQQQQEQNDDQMDKETAEQILQALEQDEQDTQEKMQRQQGRKKRVEKEW